MSSFLAKVSVLGTLLPPETYAYNYVDVIRFNGLGLSSIQKFHSRSSLAIKYFPTVANII
jgi:hypothetical protein